MEIKNINTQSFTAFYRNSPPCLEYLSRNFGGSRLKFNKALAMLDERCAKHQHFNMFYVPYDNSIHILPKKMSSPSVRFLNVEHIIVRENIDSYDSLLKKEPSLKNVINVKNEETSHRKSFWDKIFKILNIGKKKVLPDSYEYLPANVRVAVDAIDRFENIGKTTSI